MSESSTRPLSNHDLAAKLSAVSPHLCTARLLHLDRYGTLIPHVFMADVLARVGACQAAFTAEGSNERREVEAILALLELAVRHGDLETRNVISLSFIDDATSEPFFPRLWALLGPNLRAQAAAP